MRRQTLKSPIQVSGTGVHSGAAGTVTLEPAPFGSGRVFLLDGGGQIPVHVDRVQSLPGATVLASGGQVVRTPEHLLAALVALGISDVRIRLLGPEVPILDGSARPWCEALENVGVVAGPLGDVIRLPHAVRVDEAGGWAEARPSEHRVVSVEVDYDDPALPRGQVSCDLDSAEFVSAFSAARTYVLERDVEAALAAGLGKGASKDNTVLWTQSGPRHPLRMPDEVVRHKLVDLVGDLALLGAPLLAEIHVHRGSHRLHHALLRAMIQAMNKPASE